MFQITIKLTVHTVQFNGQKNCCEAVALEETTDIQWHTVHPLLQVKSWRKKMVLTYCFYGIFMNSDCGLRSPCTAWITAHQLGGLVKALADTGTTKDIGKKEIALSR
jgi:hypothetical protein